MKNDGVKKFINNSNIIEENLALITSILLLIFSIIALLYSIVISFNTRFSFNKISGNINNDKQFTIIFEAGEDVTTSGTQEILATCGSLSNIEVPTKSGYNFLGYYWSDTGEKIYNADGTVAKPSFCNPQGGSWSLESKWEKQENIKTQTIKFDMNNPTTVGFPNEITAIVGNDLPKVISVPKKTGYKFLGYYDANGVKYYNDDGTSAKKSDSIAEVTVKAKWQKMLKKIYTISIDNNGIGDTFDAVGNKHIYKIKVEEGGSIPRIAVPTLNNYNLMGYYYNDKQYYNSYGNAVRNFEETSDITVVAKWVKNNNSTNSNSSKRYKSSKKYNNTKKINDKTNIQKKDEQINNSQTNSAANIVTDVDTFGKKIESNGVSITMPSFDFDNNMVISCLDVTSTTGSSLKSKFKNAKNIAIYNLSVGDYKINGTMLEISLPIPANFNANTLKVYSLDSSKNKINISKRINGNNIIFNTPNLGLFAIVDYKENSLEKNESATLFTGVNNDLVGGIKLSGLNDSNLTFELVDVTKNKENKELKNKFNDMKDILIIDTKLRDTQGNLIDINKNEMKQMVKIPDDWDSKKVEVYDASKDNKTNIKLAASTNEKTNKEEILLHSKVSNGFVEFTTDHLGKFVIAYNENIESKSIKEEKEKKNDIFYLGFIISIIGIILSITIIIKYFKDRVIISVNKQ